jgi:autotransporter-associated beta strand protein
MTTETIPEPKSRTSQTACLTRCLAALLGVAMAASAGATDIPLNNASLESPSYYNPNAQYPGWVGINNWEVNFTGWSMWGDRGASPVANDGSQGLWNVGGYGWCGLSQNSSYTVQAAGETLTAGVWAKTESGSAAWFHLELWLNSAQVATVQPYYSSLTNWTQVTATYVTTAADIGKTVGIEFGLQATSGYAYMDSASLATEPSGAPTLAGTNSPNPASLGDSVLFTVTVTNGTSPTINSVWLNAAPIGGSSAVSLVSAGGNVYTNRVTVAGATDFYAPFNLQASAVDALSQTGYANISMSVNAPTNLTWGGGNGNWTATNWQPYNAGGPRLNNQTAVVTNGTVTVNRSGGVGILAGITLAKTGVMLVNNGYYGSYGNILFQGGSLNTSDGSAYNAYGSSLLTAVTASGLTNSTIAATGGGWFNLVYPATTFTVSNGATLTVSAPLRGAAGNPDTTYLASGLIKAGGGTLVLSGANQYSGGTVVSAGTLSLSNAAALVAASSLTVSNGATVNLGYAGTLTIETLVLGGVTQPSGTHGAPGSGATYTSAYFTGSGVLSVPPANLMMTWTGAQNGNWNESTANWTNSLGFNKWYNSQLSPNHALFGATGVGTVTLAAAMTAQSITFNNAGYTLTGGSLTLTGTSAITNNANATIVSPITSGALNKYGTGTLTLSGNSTFSGGTTVNAGTLQLTANSGNCPVTGALTVNPGATVTTTGDGTGLGWNGGQRVTTLNINGGTVSSAGSIHIWNLSGGVNLTGGTLSANSLQWGDTVVNTFASSTNSVIAGQLNIRADDNSANASLLQLNVADGPAATDLLISANITQSGLPVGATTGGRCGITKTGAGTLRITGAVQITGMISVEAGTLDFAPSAVNTNARIAVASGAHLLLSNAGTNLVKNVFIDGVKLAAGRWGAPGSVAAGAADFESPMISGPGVVQVTDHEPSARERWKRMKYGQFTHYVYWGVMPDGSSFNSADFAADNFNAPKYADDLQSMGVEYVIFTAWHANFVPMFNSAAVLRSLGFVRNSSRDMVGDMITAVRAKGIRVILYAHPNQPVIYDWWGHNNMLNDCYGEMMDRYGDQIDGFWLDENDPGGNQDGSVDFPRLERTVRRRNPDVVMIQNYYGNIYSSDVGTTEWGPGGANFSPDIGYASPMSAARPMAPGWSVSVSTNEYAARASAEGMFRATVVAAGSCTEGGGIGWAAGPYPGGLWEQGVLEAMQGVGALMAPIAESITNTYPSTSWPVFGGFMGNINGAVATRSPDGTKEYVHVLYPPGGNTLTLPAPADGKVFANARLLANSAPVTLQQNDRAVIFTLTGTNTWNTNDTVIALDVVSPGDLYLANDTTRDAVYSGSWTYLPGRSTTEFKRDVHETTANGAYVEFAFNGTAVELFATRASDCGTVDILLDGAFQQTVNAQSPTNAYRQAIYQTSGLARGNHTLKAVKTGGTRLTIDAFRATEVIDSADPAVACEALTFFNNTATAYNPVGYIVYDGNWSWQQRDRNEYNYDAHWASGNGSTFWIHFNGTGVQFIGTLDGIIDFYIDDVFVKTAYMGSGGSLARVLGLDLKGLPPGNHVLKGVKVGDTYALVDAFFVYNGQNSSWFTQADSTAISNSWRRSYAYGDVATIAFTGTGIEAIAPHGSAGGTAVMGLSVASAALPGAAFQGVNWEAVSQYSGVNSPQSVTFASRNVANLAAGNYLLSMSHNRPFGSVSLDAFRVYKSQPGTGPAYFWGATGGGGSGTWNVNTNSNWWDGTSSTVWYDFGAPDYAAIFGGTAGTVTLASGVNVNRMTFNTTGYTLQNGSINFNGLNPGVTVASNVLAIVGSPISGSVGITKDGAGTLKLTGANTYTGATINGGTLELNGATGGNGQIHGAVAVNPGATLALTGGDGTGFGYNNNPITRLTVNGGTVNASGGSHIGFGNAVTVTLTNGAAMAGNWQWNGDNKLTFSSSGDSKHVISGSVVLRSDDGANHTFNVADGAAAIDLQIDASLSDQWPEYQVVPASALIKTGAGTLVLHGTNTYDGITTVSAGRLGGTGSIRGPVTVQSGAALSPGASIGTLTISNTLTLQAGSQTFVELNAATGTNDHVRGLTTVNYGGTLVVTNVAGNVIAGQTFKLFSATGRTGNFGAISGAPGVTWSFNPTNGVLTAITAVALNPTNVAVSLSGTNLTIAWPADHLGWTLLQQTNHLQQGVSADTNDWMRVAGSSATNSVVIPILPGTPGGYYRLVYP